MGSSTIRRRSPTSPAPSSPKARSPPIRRRHALIEQIGALRRSILDSIGLPASKLLRHRRDPGVMDPASGRLA
jgi:hypothetical protein